MEPEKRPRGLSYNWALWLFPAFALALCAWLFLSYVKESGPMIQIRFDDASGIQAERTRVRFRGVTIGVVKDITLSPDGKDALAHVQLERDADEFAVEGAKFALILPKVGFQGVSGLETIFEGTYIAALPGKDDADEKLDFDGRVGMDISDLVEDTVPYHLEAVQLGSVSVGDPVMFRGLAVGTVTKIHLTKDARRVQVQVNLQNRYARLVRTNTRFWRRTAVQAKLGLFNSEIKVSSLDALMKGGIDFFTPDAVGAIAKAGSRFDLESGAPKDSDKWNPRLD